MGLPESRLKRAAYFRMTIHMAKNVLAMTRPIAILKTIGNQSTPALPLALN
jgi:hypothetical protein